jgi:thymidine kinase
MKSGKSSELIARVEPHVYADHKVLYVRTNKNVRDSGINSRLGLNTNAISVSSLKEVKEPFDAIGIDEINMFDPDDAKYIAEWVASGKHVFVSGLDLDYRGLMPPIVKLLYQIKPDNIITKIAVCDVCRSYTAQFTQILDNHEPVLDGLPLITPEDGRFNYQARCRDCFKSLNLPSKSKINIPKPKVKIKHPGI